MTEEQFAQIIHERCIGMSQERAADIATRFMRIKAREKVTRGHIHNILLATQGK